MPAYPKNPNICDPILVNLLKMRPHYSRSSRENATPSSGTSVLASCKGEPPPTPKGIAVSQSDSKLICSCFFLLELTDFVKDPITYMFNQVGGEMVAQQEGYYYVYSQVFFENYQDVPSGIYRNSVELYVNDVRVGVMQTGIDNRADYGTEYTGQVVKLNVGDRIGLKTVSESRIWLTSYHTFFGAYRIDSDSC